MQQLSTFCAAEAPFTGLAEAKTNARTCLYSIGNDMQNVRGLRRHPARKVIEPEGVTEWLDLPRQSGLVCAALVLAQHVHR